VTLEAYVETWKKRAEGEIQPGTFANYVDNLDRHVLPTLGGLRVRDIHRARVRDLLAAKKTTGLGKNSVRLIRAALSVVLSEAMEDDIIATNPCFQPAPRSNKPNVQSP
jgi:integrase-like protein